MAKPVTLVSTMFFRLSSPSSSFSKSDMALTWFMLCTVAAHVHGSPSKLSIATIPKGDDDDDDDDDDSVIAMIMMT